MTADSSVYARAERSVLSFFPLLYILAVVPALEKEDAILSPKLVLIVSLLAVIVLLRMAQNRGTSIRHLPRLLLKQPTSILLALAFSLSAVLSTLLSGNVSGSWTGDVYFKTGSFFIVVSVLTFWLYATARGLSDRWIRVSIITLSVITVLEFFGLRPLAFALPEDMIGSSKYPAATISQRGQLAGLLIFGALYLLTLQDRRSLLNTVALLVTFIALGCTSNSTATLSMLVVLSAYAFFKAATRTLTPAVAAVTLFGAASLFAHIPLTTLNRALSSALGRQTVSQPKNLASTTTLETRLLLWKASVAMFLDKPVLGWGPQTFSEHAYKYLSEHDGDHLIRLELGIPDSQPITRRGSVVTFVTPEGESGVGMARFASPHGALLDLLYSQGIIGVVLLTLTLYSLSRSARIMPTTATPVVWLPYVGYLIYLQAWFVTVHVTLFVIMAAGITLSNLSRREHRGTTHVDQIEPPMSAAQEPARTFTPEG